MAVREVLRLGNPRLYERSEWITKREVPHLGRLVRDLHDTLMDFRNRYGAGRAIAAPQIGVMKKLVYMYIERPVVFLNPILNRKSRQKVKIWDDCMCFPDLLVKVSRHQRCRVSYRDKDWKECEMFLEGDLSELLQHEVDHLDGVLAVSRAIDKHSFALRSQKNLIKSTTR
jgi:peptide deformylase